MRKAGLQIRASKRSASRAGLAISLIFVVSASTAQAGQLTAKQALSTFNLVTSGNVSTQQDIEGSAVIGGSLNGATFFNNDVPASPLIYLYGALGNGPLNLDNKGNLYYGGNIQSGQVNFNGGGQHLAAPANPITDYTTVLNHLSTSLAGLAASPGTSIVNGTFRANGATGLVVFNLTAAQLASDLQNQQIQFSGSGITGFIINVTGNFSEPSGINFNTPQQDALFNFSNATSVSLGNWKASVLAPYASLGIQNGFIAGSVYAASFTGGGELHNDNLYNGALPSSGAVPEPTTWAMMLVGMGVIGFTARRRQNVSVTCA